MMDKDLKFIVRLKSSDYKKEQSSLTENDQDVYKRQAWQNQEYAISHNTVPFSSILVHVCINC